MADYVVGDELMRKVSENASARPPGPSNASENQRAFRAPTSPPEVPHKRGRSKNPLPAIINSKGRGNG